jgi:RHS repeat-associated protein
MTLKDAAQSSPADASYVTNSLSASSKTTSTTTSVGNDLLLSISSYSGGGAASFGSGETQTFNQTNGAGLTPMVGSWKAASGYPATESMTTNISSGDIDEAMVALEGVGNGTSTTTTSTYTYAGTDYANPHAPTSIATGYSTTTFAYDNAGNVVQKTVDGTTTTYVWDYANRLIALGVGGATTTFGYDAFGQRVLQTGTSTTTIYPFKWYSVASSTGTGAKFATTTDYVFNGDSLVATIDQQTASGNATGTAKTRYIHPDRLGSTNVVTDESGNLVQTLDYYPYGSTRVSVATSTNERRQFIGQFTDDSALSYLQARYYDSARGQFLSEDPVFLGDPNQQRLQDPQSLNAYSYGEDNPITNKDPDGRDAYGDFFYNFVPTAYRGSYNQFATNLSNSSPAFDFAISHPYLTSGGLSVGLASVGAPTLEAYETYVAATGALEIGNTTAATARILPFLAYSGAATGNLLTLPSYFNGIMEANSTGNYGPIAFETGLRMVPVAGNAYGALTSSLLISNLSTGVASLGTLTEDLNYAALVLSNLNTQRSSAVTSGTSNKSTGSSSGGSGSGGSSSGGAGSATQRSSNNGGWGNVHTACGTLCI